jgi:hypothetical protein
MRMKSGSHDTTNSALKMRLKSASKSARDATTTQNQARGRGNGFEVFMSRKIHGPDETCGYFHCIVEPTAKRWREHHESHDCLVSHGMRDTDCARGSREGTVRDVSSEREIPNRALWRSGSRPNTRAQRRLV